MQIGRIVMHSQYVACQHGLPCFSMLSNNLAEEDLSADTFASLIMERIY